MSHLEEYELIRNSMETQQKKKPNLSQLQSGQVTAHNNRITHYSAALVVLPDLYQPFHLHRHFFFSMGTTTTIFPHVYKYLFIRSLSFSGVSADGICEQHQSINHTKTDGKRHSVISFSLIQRFPQLTFLPLRALLIPPWESDFIFPLTKWRNYGNHDGLGSELVSCSEATALTTAPPLPYANESFTLWL